MVVLAPLCSSFCKFVENPPEVSAYDLSSGCEKSIMTIHGGSLRMCGAGLNVAPCGYCNCTLCSQLLLTFNPLPLTLPPLCSASGVGDLESDGGV